MRWHLGPQFFVFTFFTYFLYVRFQQISTFDPKRFWNAFIGFHNSFSQIKPRFFAKHRKSFPPFILVSTNKGVQNPRENGALMEIMQNIQM